MTRGSLSLRALGFSLLYLVGLALTTRTGAPGAEDPLSSLPGFYDDRGNRIMLLAGSLVLVAAAPFLLWFVTGLASALSRIAEGWEAGLALAGGVVFATMTAAAAVPLGLVAGEVLLRDVSQPSPELERWLSEIGYVFLLLPAMAGAVVAVLSLSSAIRRVDALPGWLAWTGFFVSAVCFAALPIAIVTDLIWSQLPVAAWTLAAAVVVDARSARAV
jgi:hypothetical protein